jgi:hypothetical protein
VRPIRHPANLWASQVKVIFPAVTRVSAPGQDTLGLSIFQGGHTLRSNTLAAAMFQVTMRAAYHLQPGYQVVLNAWAAAAAVVAARGCHLARG